VNVSRAAKNLQDLYSVNAVSAGTVGESQTMPKYIIEIERMPSNFWTWRIKYNSNKRVICECPTKFSSALEAFAHVTDFSFHMKDLNWKIEYKE